MQNYYGLPAGFWVDDFILGFFGFLIGFHATIATNGRLSVYDKGLVIIAAFTDLSHMNGSALAKRFTALGLADDGGFKQGADNAALIAFYTSGLLKAEEENEHVVQAMDMARRAGDGGDRATIAAFLTQQLFFEEVMRRFPEIARGT